MRMIDGLIMCISDFYVSTGFYIAELEDYEERMILTASMARSNDLLVLITSNSEAIINIMALFLYTFARRTGGR